MVRSILFLLTLTRRVVTLGPETWMYGKHIASAGPHCFCGLSIFIAQDLQEELQMSIVQISLQEKGTCINSSSTWKAIFLPLIGGNLAN